MVCHALIHAGKLGVDGDPATGLTFRARGDALRVPLPPLPPASSEPRSSARADRGVVEFEDPTLPEPALVAALEKLGFSRRDARQRLARARTELSATLGRAPSEVEVLVKP